MKWLKGRQHLEGVPYFKLPILISKKLLFDIYVLKYPQGSRIGWHIDPAIDGYKHTRINIIINKAKGGVFQTLVDGKIISHPKRVIKFRPDITTHCVSEIERGTRYVLSIGWLSRNK